MSNKIFVGTSNKGKIREIASVLSPLGYELEPVSCDVDEIGETIEDNAKIKAIEYSKKHRDCYVICEDSGLVVPKLNGLPGAYSSRFHTIQIDSDLNVINVPKEVYTTDKTELDRLNNTKLLELIKNLPENQRAAYFEVCFCIAKDEKILFSCSNKSYGYIIDELRGNNGFGYDPVFVGTDTYGKTYAELDTARKNMRSHRKKALQELGLWISKNIEL